LNKKKNPPVDLKIIEVPGPSTRKKEKQMENKTAASFHFSNLSPSLCEDFIIDCI